MRAAIRSHQRPAVRRDARRASAPRRICVKQLGCRVTGGGSWMRAAPITPSAIPHAGLVRARHLCESGHRRHAWRAGGRAVGVATPFTPDSACIAGEWTHVRHIKKGLAGNFHARSFDSLECAVPLVPTLRWDTTIECSRDCDCGANGPCTSDPATSRDGTLCNDSDRICGPSRRARRPTRSASRARKLCTHQGQAYARSVVFRVDVEDRGSPGHEWPAAARSVSERIWFVDPDTSDGLSLRQAWPAQPATEDISAPRRTSTTGDLSGQPADSSVAQEDLPVG